MDIETENSTQVRSPIGKETQHFYYTMLKSSTLIEEGFLTNPYRRRHLLAATITHYRNLLIRKISCFRFCDNALYSYSSQYPILRLSIHDKLHIVKLDEHYFITYHLENNSTVLSLYYFSNKGVKKLATMKLGIYIVRVFENAVCYLGTPFIIAFLVGDGKLRILDLRARKVLDESLNGVEQIKYNSRGKILALKSGEELYLVKLRENHMLAHPFKQITGEEAFNGDSTLPSTPLMIKRFKDLKAFEFDETSNTLYVIFAWIIVDVKLTAPKVSHIRIQKWRVGEDCSSELLDQKDLEWNHIRSQKFKICSKEKLCFVSDQRLYVISLTDYQVMVYFQNKEFLTIHEQHILLKDGISHLY